MAKRGAELREHILWTAKDVFLEMGFERSSMDLIANHAGTSKRSLYAHFESKEVLFLAVIELVRGPFLDQLKTPGDYSNEPAEALIMFCRRYLELLLCERTVQMCRICMAESKRFPEGAAQQFNVMFTEPQARLNAFLKAAFELSDRTATEAARTLLGQILFPRFQGALFRMAPRASGPAEESLSLVREERQLRETVTDLIDCLQRDRL